jgi:hypothetical protein
MHLSGVGGLLFWRSPPAIARLVVAIIVDAIEGGAGGARAHVSGEVREGLTPSVANDNPAATVAVPFAVGLGVATTHH